MKVRLAALLAALALVLVGCSDDEPEPTPQPTPTAPASESATATPPATDQTAAPRDPEETIRGWVAARNDAMSGGDLDAVRDLSSPECSSCADLIDPIERIYADGGHLETTGWRVLRSKLTKETPSAVEVTAALALAGGTTFTSATAEPVTYGPERRIAIFELTQSGGIWTVSLIGFVR